MAVLKSLRYYTHQILLCNSSPRVSYAEAYFQGVAGFITSVIAALVQLRFRGFSLFRFYFRGDLRPSATVEFELSFGNLMALV